MKKTYVTRWYYVLVAIIFSVCVEAETISVEYAKFFSHTRKLDADDTHALQFAFGFLHVGTQELCHLNSVSIVTPKQRQAVAVSGENRFVLPSDKVLKLAEAQVVVDMQERANQCDLSVQLETKPEFLKTHYSADELSFIFRQYQAFFNEMGGMLSFMMPQVTGLHFYVSTDTRLKQNTDGLTIKAGQLSVSEQWWSANKQLILSETPLRITAQTTR